MDGVIGVAILAALGYWCFKAGKSEGSRKGYGVGRAHQKKANRRHISK